jgi:Uma2 family endonuclease
MAMQAMQAEMQTEATPSGEPSQDPASERRLAWETLRERDLEEKMGQGSKHAEAVKLFVDVSTRLRDEQQREAYIGWDVFVEWDPNDPRARVSPDMFVLDGQSPSITPSMWCTWEPGCDPPSFALEIVSPKSRAKDYDQNPMRYAALGVLELAIFDPEPRGEDAFRLQLYRRSSRGQFLRVYAGPGPAESKVLRAWLVIVDGGAHVRLARDAAGEDRVLTAEERAVVAEARVRELEAMVAAHASPPAEDVRRGA